MRARAVIVAAGLILAAPAARSDDASEQRAKRLFIEAAKLVDAGKLRKALDNYRQAYELVPRPKILLNIAAVLADLGRPADQANTYQEYLDHPRKNFRRAKRIEANLAKLDDKLGRLQLRIAAGGRVSVNGEKIGEGPVVVVHRVRAGSHAIIARFDTGTVAKEISVARGQQKSIELQAPPAEQPGGDDGKGGSDTTPDPRLDPQEPAAEAGTPIYAKPWLYTLIGTAGAAGAGLYFGSQATSAEDEYAELIAGGPVEYSEAKDIQDRGERNATFSTVAFISAGALAVASGVLLYFDLRSDGGGQQEPGVAIAPLAEGGAMVVRGWEF